MPDARALRPTAADQTEALRLGFDRVGVARARAFPQAATFAGGWRKTARHDGLHGEGSGGADPAVAFPARRA